jgi:inner membrane transporter RhtA
MYVFTNHRVGNLFKGYEGISVSMFFGALVTAPFALSRLHVMTSNVHVASRMVIVSIMVVVLGFGFEMQSLRRIRPSTAGVLMAFDPAFAFMMGALLLGQHMQVWDFVGLSCVVAAGIGVTYDSANEVVDLGQ